MAEGMKRIEMQEDFEFPQKSSSRSEEKDTEASRFSTFARSRAQAKKQSRQNPEDRVAAELQKIEGELAGTEGAGDTSLDAHRTGPNSAVIDLKTEVPLTGEIAGTSSPLPSSDEGIGQSAPSRESYSHTAPRRDSRGGPNKKFNFRTLPATSPEEENFDPALDAHEPFPLSDSQTPFQEADGVPSTQSNEALNGETEDQTNQEEQRMRQNAIQQEQKNAREAAVTKQQKQAEADTKKRKLRAFQQFQAQIAPIVAEESRRRQLLGIQMQQEKKLRDLKSKRKRTKIELRVAEAIKTTVKLTQDFLLWAAEGLLPWSILIIPLILAVIFFVFWLLLWPGRLSAIATVAYLKHKLNSIEEDIAKAEQNKQKATSMIQSMQRTKRTNGASGQKKWSVKQA